MSSTLADYRAQGVTDGRRYPVDAPSARSLVRGLCGLDAANAYQEGFDEGREAKRAAFADFPSLRDSYTDPQHWASLPQPAVFAITAVEHRSCGQCRELAKDAASIARATGSTGATHRDGAHSVTVVRSLGSVTL